MITSNLKGGLGNQMFQISAAVALALENNDTAAFDFQKCFTPNQGNPSLFYLNNIFKNIVNMVDIPIYKIYYETKFSFNKIDYEPNLLLDGYFQSEKYFKPQEDKIRELFYIDDKIFDNSEITTSVHIRRGDYQKFSNFHRVLDLEYYHTAINRIGGGNFLFFSDDIEWAKKTFVSKNFFFSENSNELDDFYLMSKCKNNIIANSSFSWWAAYLNKNKNKTIISPKQENWFGVDGHKDTQDIIPETWIQI